ncbi:cytidylate kinase [Neorhodopirellula lusitana]|uniref:Cytidylate kinase n=1 Tax=Neorhodopirellula lusitana TaxID=445327 RepID=A0ABY1PN56_9BACT|nr:(d)CMP kinase [Neorhodopirellula lusitana]SMP37977.1 cytidylate kinase [Neorhodopirellula lusitana]
MIITIDGPAGAGKSSIAREVATDLGFAFLDTGAMYRAITLGAMRRGIAFDDVLALVDYAQQANLSWKDDRIDLDEQDISVEIRTPAVTSNIRYIADPPEIRGCLTMQQRRIAEGRNLVTEGRDQGTEVFPEAECKVFLTASPEERAKRRHLQLQKAGKESTYEEVLMAQNQRDLEDRMRPVGRLRAALDAVVIQTDGMTSCDVKQAVLGIVRSNLQAISQPDLTTDAASQSAG